MRFRCFVVSCLLLLGFGFAASSTAASTSSEPTSIDRQLSDGAPCTIRIQSDGELSITILVNGAEIQIPPECLTDLSDCNVPDGVQVADFAGDMFLLLAGGEGESSWQAKLTLRSDRVIQRELYRNGARLPEILSVQPVAEPPPALSISTTGSVTLQFPDAQPIFKGEEAP